MTPPAPLHLTSRHPERLATLAAQPQRQLLLYTAQAARAIEQAAAAGLPAHTLMQRAGLAVARLALAVQPHAHRIWIVAGRGNNGGDGLEAAIHLLRAGRDVRLSLLAGSTTLPADAAQSYQRAVAAGVTIDITEPARPPWVLPDLVIDAVLGRGLSRPAQGASAQAIAAMRSCGAPVLAVDLPSGLPGDTGALDRTEAGPPSPCVSARWTLALLSLAPGAFTADGRDHIGELWWDDLGVEPGTAPVAAGLSTAGSLAGLAPSPAHSLHKGSRGDVLIVGGASGMGGAIVLASRRALASGAGRVYVHPLDPNAAAIDPLQPELMVRLTLTDELLAHSTVAAGCGGGQDVARVLPQLLALAPRLLLDADALNAVSAQPDLLDALRQRQARGQASIATPHPLEAARLLGISTQELQSDRLKSAQALARHLGAVVVLKGSGTVVARPGGTPWINTSGNSALATAGSGDVLAGWIAALWAQLAAHHGSPGAPDEGSLQVVAEQAARIGVHEHGAMAQQLSPDGQALPASRLAVAR
jgi:hydroxyethylthiazole kinase-like uncharacterized protein yjeF